MSWNFRMCGLSRDVLKKSVAAQSAPDAIKAEVCARIDAVPIFDEGKQAIFIESSGHLDPKQDRPWYSVDEIKIRVWAIPFNNTPL